jgi:two-component system response regulator FixJ
LPNSPVIAVLDDDASMREAFAEFLQLHSMSCHVFDRAEAFLAAYAPGQFDCLVTDLRMPGMDGLELQQELRNRGSTMPVIVVTSSLDPVNQQRAMTLGAHAYLIKPVGHDVLLHQLRTALGLERGGRPGDSEALPNG